MMGIVRLLARQRGNLPAVAEEAQRLQAVAEAPEAVQLALGEELRGLALISLGISRALDPACRAYRQSRSRARGGARRPLRTRSSRAGARP